MKDFVIMTDSGCDLSQTMIEENKIEVVPMGFVLDNVSYKHYHDFRELSVEDFYDKLKNGHIGSTSGVNIMDTYVAMEKYVKNNIGVVYLSFSSGMSSSYQSAFVAARNIRETYPEASVEVIDTLSASVGLGMLVYLAVKEKNSGKSMQEVVDYINDIKLNVCHCLMVDDLNYLKKSGRISMTSSLVGIALAVRPILEVSDEGRVVFLKKVKGFKSAINYISELVNEKCTKNNLFFICHADAEEKANMLVDRIKEIYPESEIHINQASPIIGNNVGPGSLAIVFYGDKR